MATGMDFVKITGITWAEVGTDGAMGTPLERHGFVKEDSYVPNTPAPTDTPINVEELDGSIYVQSGAIVRAFACMLLNTTMEDLAFYEGGTYTPAGAGQAEEYTPPTVSTDIFKSCQVDYVNKENETVTLEYPRVKITTQNTNAIGKNNASGLDLAVSIQTPFDAAGEALPQFKFIGAPATT